ncbi:MAG: hypothetical protein HY710_01275, partial [Candidatus Latescibacteria bacterium]|nr:hypothetical protein [Candidatus Latescibacterota bacterium]
GTLALPNHAGWGHCIIVSHAGVTICILPGPPHEVQALFSQYIESKLATCPDSPPHRADGQSLHSPPAPPGSRQ